MLEKPKEMPGVTLPFHGQLNHPFLILQIGYAPGGDELSESFNWTRLYLLLYLYEGVG